jgi:glycerol-1-phosphate dehydrogenase [NAD(P)+]
MSYVNNSRPASGSEHHLSHFFEITGILEGTEYFPHGVDVICSSYYTEKVREKLLSIDLPERNEKISREKYEKEIKRIYHSLDKEIIALQDKMGWYNLDKYEIYKNKWEEIKKILSEAPSSEEMASYIEKIGLDLDAFESFYGKSKIEDALWFAKDLKDRYTVLWLYFELLYK